MEREEGLVVKRHHPDRIVWEPGRDFVRTLRRAFNVGGRGYALSRAVDVAATCTAVDADRTLVMLEADLRGSRERLAWGTAAASAGGLGAAGIMSMVLTMAALPLAIVPAVLIPTAGVFVARRVQTRTAQRAQLALEQILDRLERGELPRQQSIVGALSAAAAAVTAAAQPRRR
jgi:hypothetical protein